MTAGEGGTAYAIILASTLLEGAPVQPCLVLSSPFLQPTLDVRPLFPSPAAPHHAPSLATPQRLVWTR